MTLVMNVRAPVVNSLEMFVVHRCCCMGELLVKTEELEAVRGGTEVDVDAEYTREGGMIVLTFLVLLFRLCL